MKKLVLLMTFALITLCVHAQQKESKNMWIGGSLGFSSGESDETNVSSYNIGPEWGMMLNDDFGAGVKLTIRGDDYGSGTDNLWIINPYVRYYKGISDNFKFFAEGSLLVGGGDNRSIFGIGARPGVQYWLTSRWSMASTLGFLGYRKVTHEKDTPHEFDDKKFGLDLDMSTLDFSLYYHF